MKRILTFLSVMLLPLAVAAQHTPVETMLLTGHGFYMPDPGSEPFVGRPLPDFRLTTFDGRTVTSASLRGKVVVLDFWATWCGWCKRLTADLDRELGRRNDPRTVILGVNCRESDPEAAADYWRTSGWSFDAVWQGDELGRQLQACHPTVVVADAQGVIRWHSNGWSATKAREVALLADYLHGDLELTPQAVRRAIDAGDGVKALFMVDLLIGGDPQSEASLCGMRIEALRLLKHPETERYVEQVRGRYPAALRETGPTN